MNQIDDLIQQYSIRLLKIKRASAKIGHQWTQEKAWKESAVKQTQLFLKELKRLKRHIGRADEQG